MDIRIDQVGRRQGLSSGKTFPSFYCAPNKCFVNLPTIRDSEGPLAQLVRAPDS